MRRTVPLITAAMLLSWLYVHERFVRDDFDRAFTRSLHMVSTRYKTMSIPHGWAYRHAQTKGKVILVSVLIPGEHAQKISAMPERLRRSVVSIACPKVSEEVWSVLPVGAQISVRGEGPKGTAVATVICGG
ncbi:MAG: hypothetical protein HOB79_20125 [Rhodospirillaceae bacterium]|jgi:hypothetical protein|nr:hypothetical protein [Rhodospirillales bacterium]MBT3905870.1 hypothetical protein [Rhodospirillaceae bacterium]MBT4703388.1 hypothetical protein [Rhodospirillaceae bacterium]MBT5035100.1 hypothetical protein [Rhodospirillaceae bacterium]MBT6221108.1 hypothetical protein [Rhodospirillaceae bacterium]